LLLWKKVTKTYLNYLELDVFMRNPYTWFREKIRRKPKAISTAPRGRRMNRRDALRIIALAGGAAMLGQSGARAETEKRSSTLKAKPREPERRMSGWFADLEQLKKDYAIKFKANYFAHKKSLADFLKKNPKIVLDQARGIDYEKGGYIYKKDGQIHFKWVEDPADAQYHKVAGQLKTGDFNKVNVSDLDKILQRLKGAADANPNERVYYDAFNKFRGFLTKYQSKEPISQAEIKRNKESLGWMTKFLTQEANFAYSDKAYWEAITFEGGNKGIVLCTFHTHPSGKVSESDLKRSHEIPEAVFEINGEKITVNFLVDGEIKEQFEIH